jgi:16S rRNA U516 pseudouridylate synthase RsuA-like enzyme
MHVPGKGSLLQKIGAVGRMDKNTTGLFVVHERYRYDS